MNQDFASTVWTKVEAASSGDDEALKWFVDAYYLPIRAVILRFLRKYGRKDAEHLAEEFVQNAFLKLLSDPTLLAKASRNHGGHFRAYMTALVKNLIQNDLRHHRRREASGKHEEIPDIDRAVEKELDDVWLAGLLSEAIERLRHEFREAGKDEMSCILAMSALEGLTPKEVAKAVGWKAPAVSRAIYKCRLRLRELVRDIAKEQRFAWQIESLNAPELFGLADKSLIS